VIATSEVCAARLRPAASNNDLRPGFRPEIPCRGDIFHVFRDLEQVVGFLENRAYDALQCAERCQRRRVTAGRYDKRGHAESIMGASRRLYLAREASDAAITLADNVALLIGWLRYDARQGTLTLRTVT